MAMWSRAAGGVRLPPVALAAVGMLLMAACAIGLARNDGVLLMGDRYSAGSVRVGQPIDHAVQIWNTKLAPIEISVEPACGCTLGLLGNRRLAPLRGTVLRVHLDTAGMAPGPHAKDVALRIRAGHRTWTQRYILRFIVR